MIFLVKDFLIFAESRTRGHCYKLIKPRCETSFRLRSFSQRVITDWNSLPYDVVTAQTLNSFKKRVDTKICTVSKMSQKMRTLKQETRSVTTR